MLSQKEFDKRCKEVFVAQEGDEYFSISVNNNKVKIFMYEVDKHGELVGFDYEPDMSKRPEALAYLLGERDDFND